MSLKTAHPAVSVSLEADAKELGFVLQGVLPQPPRWRKQFWRRRCYIFSRGRSIKVSLRSMDIFGNAEDSADKFLITPNRPRA